MGATMRKRSGMLLSAVVLVAWAAGPVRGEDWNHYWVNGSGDFENTLHWVCVETGTFWAWPPGPSDGARFGYWGWDAGRVTFNQDHTNLYMTIGLHQAIFDLNGHTYSLTLPIGVASGFGVNVGDTAGMAGSLWVENGTLSAVASCLGYASGASGEADVTAGATWQSYWLHVGWYGDGTLRVREGGRLESALSCLGAFAGSSGSVTLGHRLDEASSTWSVQDSLFVGGTATALGGHGEIHVDMTGELAVGGTLKLWSNSLLDLAGGIVTTQSLVCVPGATLQHSGGWLYVQGGTYSPGVTHLTVDGFGGPELILNGAVQEGALLRVTVGDSRSGSLSVRGGTALTTSEFYQVPSVLGEMANSSGAVTVEGGGSSWSARYIDVGLAGTGELTVQGGGSVTCTDVCVGRDPGSDGTVTVAGGGSTLSAGEDIYVGYDGIGELTIRGGGAVTCDGIGVGDRAGSHGTVTVNGADSTLITGSLSIALNGGTGELTVSNGGAVESEHAIIGGWVSSTATVTLEGAESSFTTSGDLTIPNEWATGRFTQTDGTARVGGNLNIGALSWFSNGTYEISGGILDVGDGVIVIGKDLLTPDPVTGRFLLYGGLVIADQVSKCTHGTFVWTAGTLRVNTLTGFGPDVSVAGNLQIGHAGGAGSGSYSVGASGSLSVGGDLTVGYDAPAAFSQTGGTVDVGGGLRIGERGGSTGVYTISGGALTTAGLYVGAGGKFRMAHPSAAV
ncbi:MAG TPA: hypothetical protein VFJ30_02440, partial [Phycisphaerae bacterium]|nr:hypothetical protein [Phycisphaerae bacterium]